MRNLSNAEYLELVHKLPLPTDEQIGRFVDYVSHVHSWYKGSICPPGGKYRFYLDPYAGIDAAGEGYSSIKEYRTTCGYLSHTRYRHKTTFDRKNRRVFIPAEIMDVGELRFSGVVHTLGFQNVLWDHEYYANHMDEIDWPEQSGGKEAFKEIVALASSVRERWMPRSSIDELASHEKLRRLVDSDARPHAALHVEVLLYARPEVVTLYQLLARERERQYEEMAQAIRRFCAYVEGNNSGNS